jgi:hypothetical protein
MEVAVSTIVTVPKDNTGNLPISALIKKSVSCGEGQTAKAQFSPKADAAAGKIRNKLLGRHDPIIGEDLANIEGRGWIR